MKKVFSLSLLVLVGGVTGLLGQSIQVTPYVAYATGTTNSGVNPSYAIIGCNSSVAGVSGTPVITALDATSDKLTAVVSFYKVTAQAPVTYTNSTVTLFVSQTNGFNISSGVVVVRHLATDTYEKRTLTASGQSASTNLVVTVAPWTETVPGDIVYMCASAGAGTIGLLTNTVAANSMRISLQGENLYSGQPGMPLLLEVDQTTTGGSIRSVAAKFVR